MMSLILIENLCILLCRFECHTCKMVGGEGVCTVCAMVCHKDHDLTNARFGYFFCDCGAKDDGSCKVSHLVCSNIKLFVSGNHFKRNK